MERLHSDVLEIEKLAYETAVSTTTDLINQIITVITTEWQLLSTALR